MNKMNFYLPILLVLLLGVLQAQPEQIFQQAQDRASAARAARLDAMRQLAESIQGVRITSTTTVRDFITESDEIQGAFETFLQGAQQVGEPVQQPDGTCEVTMSISIGNVVQWLSQAYRQHGSQKISSPSQFNEMTRYNSQRVFTAVGTGAMKSSPTPAYDDVWRYVTPQGKMMALRAAKVDAYRNLGETIQGVKLTSNTTVKDFVAVNDEIRASFNGVVRGVEFVGEPRYMTEGTVEVTAQIDMQKLAQMLAAICNEHYDGNKWNTQNFQNMGQSYPEQYVRATGVGVPPAKYIRREASNPGNNYPPYPPVPVPVPEEPFVPEWAKRTIKVTGTGAYPENAESLGQAKLQAKRASQMDAYRLLVEQVMGLQLRSNTTVRDFIVDKDEINGKVNAYLKGARIFETRYMPDGTAETDMELYLGDMWQIIEAHYRNQY